MKRTSVDLEFAKNQLLLNPRLPSDVRERFESAWRSLVEPTYKRHVGITTSGSSGDSLGKMIVLSHEALEASALAVNERFESDARDVWFKSLPSFHVGGLGILIRAHLSGAAVQEDQSEKWSVQDFIAQVRTSKATLISLVPTQVFDIVQAHIAAPSHVRAVIVGGGRFEESLRLRALDLGWPCLPSYGMTETCSQIATALSPEDPRLTLLSHADARVSADGRLSVKSKSLLSAQITFKPSTQSGNHHGAQIGAHLIDPKIDGWFITEDHAHIDDRVLTIEGRAHDFVKIGGEGVSVARLEEKLEQLKLALRFQGDAALVAAHDERLGATLVLLTTEPDSKALVDKFNATVAPFERIRVLKQVTEIPRSPLGKLLRAAALELVGLRPS